MFRGPVQWTFTTLYVGRRVDDSREELNSSLYRPMSREAPSKFTPLIGNTPHAWSKRAASSKLPLNPKIRREEVADNLLGIFLNGFFSGSSLSEGRKKTKTTSTVQKNDDNTMRVRQDFKVFPRTGFTEADLELGAFLTNGQTRRAQNGAQMRLETQEFLMLSAGTINVSLLRLRCIPTPRTYNLQVDLLRLAGGETVLRRWRAGKTWEPFRIFSCGDGAGGIWSSHLWKSRQSPLAGSTVSVMPGKVIVFMAKH
ncbi:hypothetical protein DFJ73DRAFT_761584 [Zopfochytrium polystomum]|nr:hypothetical protein DFJ73DRAFT_761584 [Zopfochytrium polystomum]